MANGNGHKTSFSIGSGVSCDGDITQFRLFNDVHTPVNVSSHSDGNDDWTDTDSSQSSMSIIRPAVLQDVFVVDRASLLNFGFNPLL